MDDYTTEERKAYETLVSLGIHEPIAEDCIASRNIKELRTVMEFLERYGKYIK